MQGEARNLIDELERAISSKTIGDRAATLRRVTDLFVTASGQLSEEQIELFDDVMGRLLEEIEISARAAFGHVLAMVPDAPPGVVRKLALDDAIGVAASVLTHSERIDDSTLVEGAKTKSQAHLLAISRRKTLAECVTDVLVNRGDRHVACSTARNPGAAFSEFGYSTLVRRSLSDDDLATYVWTRPEIPRQHLLKLFADASESLKLRLATMNQGKAGLILEIVAQASQQIQAKARETSPDYAAAYAYVRSLHAAGKLDEKQLAEFAQAGKFDQTTVALSIMCDLPISLAETALVDEGAEQIIILAKAADLSWPTVKAILLLQARTKDGSTPKLDRSLETFTRLHAETAKKALQFYRLRKRATLPRVH